MARWDTFTWHEFNAAHAFMRDEADDGRYDGQTAPALAVMSPMTIMRK